VSIPSRDSGTAGFEERLVDVLLLANSRQTEARSARLRGRSGRSMIENRPLRRAAFDAMPVAQLVLDPDDNLVLVTELARRMFALTDADLGRPIQDLEPFSRPVELREHLDHLRRERQPIAIEAVGWGDGMRDRVLDVRIVALALENDLVGASVSYTDVTEAHRLERQLDDIRRELGHACERLQATVEQFEIQLEQQRTTIQQLEIANQQLLAADAQLELTDDDLQAARQQLAILTAALSQLPARGSTNTPTHTPDQAVLAGSDRDSH
jgi:two-component system CheB/CheR fusion protein